jgi:threonine dehydrogenase-like Zn-dependent dehydrogenase
MKNKAVVFTAYEHAELLDLDFPDTPAPKKIQGRTVCTLVSPGTELAGLYTAKYFPGYPGYAAIFRADQVGSEVKDIKPGGLYFTMGQHCAMQQSDAEFAIPIPDGLAPEKAVILRLMGVSLTTLMTTKARPGDRVIVSGLGPVGHLAAQMFAASGYDVIAVDPDDTRRQYLEKRGPSAFYPKCPVDDTKLAGTIALVVDCSGHEQAVLDGCKMVRKGGEVVLVGVPWKKLTEVTAHELLHAVFHKYVVLRSGWEWELPGSSADFRPHSIMSSCNLAAKWLKEGRVNVDGLVEMSDPMGAQCLYQDLLNRRASGLFQVFDWRKIAGQK